MRTALVLILLVAVPAQAHEPPDLDACSLVPCEPEWVEAWNTHKLTWHPQRTATRTVFRGVGSNVEQWRPLVAAYFPAETVNTMLCIMAGESGGNPDARNPSSGAAGLFQVMPFWWDHYGGDRYDPETNVRVAKLIWEQQGYGAWSVWNRGKCNI